MSNEVKKIQEVSEEVIIDEAYITAGGGIIGAEDMMKSIAHKKKINEKQKSMDGSNQQDAQSLKVDMNPQNVVSPPYNTGLLTKFFDADTIHARCCRTKAADAVARQWQLEIDKNVELNDTQINRAKQEVLHFVKYANEENGFEQVLKKGALDRESIGWGCFEVIRSFDKKIKYINHIPAKRVRRLKGFNGFVEINQNTGQKTYYQAFGEKVLSANRTNLDGTYAKYNPEDDGSISSAQWNLVNKDDPKEKVAVENIKQSANELLFVSNIHPDSRYYGVPEVIPAVGSVLANIHIRDYFLQFFEHNTVPQYAIIVKGAKLSDPVKQLIHRYFEKEVKGKAHKTLLIPLPSAAGEIEVEFHRLGADVKEGSFQDTRKNNAQEIMTAHGVSAAIIGITDAASLGSGKGRAQAENYKNRIIDPLQRLWQNVLNRLFQQGLGLQGIQIHFDELDIVDKETQRKNDLAFLKQGVLTINEVRARNKLGDPIEGGNLHFVMVGQTPLPVAMLDSGVGEEELDSDMKKLRRLIKDNKELLDEPSPVEERSDI